MCDVKKSTLYLNMALISSSLTSYSPSSSHNTAQTACFSDIFMPFSISSSFFWLFNTCSCSQFMKSVERVELVFLGSSVKAQHCSYSSRTIRSIQETSVAFLWQNISLSQKHPEITLICHSWAFCVVTGLVACFLSVFVSLLFFHLTSKHCECLPEAVNWLLRKA